MEWGRKINELSGSKGEEVGWREACRGCKTNGSGDKNVRCDVVG